MTPDAPDDPRVVPFDDETTQVLLLRRWVSRILRAGALASGILLLAGIVAHALSAGPALLIPPARLDPDQVAQAFERPSAAGVVLVAVLVLALTPLTRVILSAGIFARSRDRPMLAITAFVLAMLALTILGGVAF